MTDGLIERFNKVVSLTAEAWRYDGLLEAEGAENPTKLARSEEKHRAAEQAAREFREMLAIGRVDDAMPIGTPVVKPEGYPFPGEVRAAFRTRAQSLRYVVEATGPDYRGMLHIYSPSQLKRTDR